MTAAGEIDGSGSLWVRNRERWFIAGSRAKPSGGVQGPFDADAEEAVSSTRGGVRYRRLC